MLIDRTGFEKSALVIHITKSELCIVSENVSELGETQTSAGVNMVPTCMEAILSLSKKKMDYKSEGGEVESCMICVEDVPTGLAVSTLPCSQVFHTNCISEWLTRRHYCPIYQLNLDVVIYLCHSWLVNYLSLMFRSMTQTAPSLGIKMVYWR